MTWKKHKKYLESALAQSMRLLVLIRESLKKDGPAAMKSPFYEAILTHANLCGTLLPNELRMSQAEIDRIRAQLELPAVAAAREISNEMQVLKPDGRGGFGI